jgi:hypothetical protein
LNFNRAGEFISQIQSSCLLKRDADGGLTLMIQNESPGKDKEATGCPRPEGHSP